MNQQEAAAAYREALSQAPDLDGQPIDGVPPFWQESGQPYWEATPPIWQPETEDDYHAACVRELPGQEENQEPLHGSTMLGDFLENPALYHARHVTGEAPFERKRPMIIGSMVDDNLLRPGAFKQTYVRQPESVHQRTGEGWETFLEATVREEMAEGYGVDGDWEAWLVAKGAPPPRQPRGGKKDDPEARWGPAWIDFLAPLVKRTIVRSADWDLAETIAGKLRSNEMADALLLGDGFPQACHAWQCPRTGIWCKFRIDHATETLVRPAMVDLKVWNVVDPAGVAKRCWDYGTHRQMALYEEGFLDLWRVRPDIFLVVAHNEQPFEVAVYQLSPEFMAAGRRDIRRAREGLLSAIATDDWLNLWQTDIVELIPPRYALNQINREIGAAAS